MKSLREIRTELGLSQRKLAKLAGILQPNIVVMERNNLQGTTIGTVSRIAKAIGCTAVIKDDAVFFFIFF